MTNSLANSPVADEPRSVPLLAWSVLAFVALWPVAAASEGVLALVTLGTLGLLVTRRLPLERATMGLCLVFFTGYWLPQLLSVFDAINPGRVWREVGVDLRYLPFLCACALAAAWRPRLMGLGIAAISAVWTLDALLQAATGWSLGGVSDPLRLTGVFGANNPKLGLILASLSPFLLYSLQARFGLAGWLPAAVLVGVAVVLAGARAAWLTYALVLMATGWRALGGGHRALLSIGAGAVLLGVLGLNVSDRFNDRLDRTLTALSGNSADLDFALSGRLPIWRAALGVAADNPFNGVGVRGFRDAWPDYVDIGTDQQPWGGGVVALHAHQWVLEVLAETGGVGLLLWLGAISIGIRAWWRATPAQRACARPAGLALAVSLFPFNTHLAVYSSFWGGVILLLAGLYAGALGARCGADRLSAGIGSSHPPSPSPASGSLQQDRPADPRDAGANRRAD